MQTKRATCIDDDLQTLFQNAAAWVAGAARRRQVLLITQLTRGLPLAPASCSLLVQDRHRAAAAMGHIGCHAAKHELHQPTAHVAA